MPRIVYFQPDGQRREVTVAAGTSIMMGAIQNNVRGIDADCGGCCSCATCHCYVDDVFLGLLTPPDENEEEMLGGTAAERRPNSRLGCQVPVTAELDGIIVRLPDRQV
ncbi:MAG: 2Fe-2S iron-sulfur cluster-binding protein [Alphaproteobacteria bacterium]